MKPAAPIARTDWPRLLALVEEAMDIPSGERDTWLASLALPGQMRDALRGLLSDRHAIETGGFLAALPALEGGRPHVEAPAGMRPGTSIGPWRLLRMLGQGGMSDVWLAERADGQVDRQVALKLPHAGPGQDLLAQRLLRERNILASLEHRHIARLYDVGVTDAGMPYLVMEFVEGDTLLAHADAKQLTVAQRVALFRQVLAAVQYAHGKLVLHRDLKPGNILVNSAGDVKLLDFGIAKVLAMGRTHDATELTQATGRRLTPAYASPEQLRGEPLGTASDVYSLGVVLYELLGGRRPFEAAGLSQAELERASLTLEPRPLGRHEPELHVARARGTSPRTLRKMLGGDVDAIVLQALAKTPERRYVSVDAFDADVERWLAGKPVSAHLPGRWYYLGKFVKRHRWPAGLGAATVVLLATAGGVALVQAHNARLQAARAASVRDFLVAMFDETDPDRAESKELTARTLLDNGRQRAEENLRGSPDLMAELLHYIGRAQANLSDRTAADDTFAAAIDAYRGLGDDRRRMLVLLDRVDNELALGRVDAAGALLKEAAALSGPFGDDPAVMGSMLRYRGYVAGFRHEWAAEKEYLAGYLALAERRPDLPPLERVQVLENLATAWAHSDALPKATALIEQALGILHGHPEIPIAARLEVLVYRQDIDFQWGRYAAIRHASPDDIRDCDRHLSPISPTCLKFKLKLHAARMRLGFYDEARALEPGLAPMLDPASPRDQLGAAAAIARALAFSGQSAARPEVEAQLERLVDAPSTASLNANYRLVAMNAIAEVQLLGGHPAQALDWLARARQLAASGMGVPTGEVMRMRALEGMAWHFQGHADHALGAMGPLCAPGDPPAGMSQVEGHYFRLNCVGPLVAQGRAAEAVVLLEHSLPVLRENFGAEAPSVHTAEQWLDSLRAAKPLPASSSRPALFT